MRCGAVKHIDPRRTPPRPAMRQVQYGDVTHRPAMRQVQYGDVTQQRADVTQQRADVGVEQQTDQWCRNARSPT